MLKTLAHAVGRRYVSQINERDAKRQLGRTNERPIEYSFAFRALNEYQPARVLDVGTGESALPSLVKTCGFQVEAVDNIRDYWPGGLFNRHYQVIDDDIRNPRRLQGQYDMILCISVLEHITEPLKAMQGMWRKLAPGGHLVLTCPFGDRYYPNVYLLPDSYGKGNTAFVTQQYCDHDMSAWLAGTALELIREEYWQCFEEGRPWSCGPLARPIQQVPKGGPHQLGCFVFRQTGGTEFA